MQKMVSGRVLAKGDIYKMDPVKLIAGGSEIILDRRAANVSGTIKNMLSGPGNFSGAAGRGQVPRDLGEGAREGRAVLPLQAAVHNHAGQLPEFKIDAEQALEAANFLDT